MKIDLVTIFPEFFDVLKISLIGKAQANGIIDIEVHDLRAVANAPHYKVDDTPYGGGAGMVMMPEPWALTIDNIFNSNRKQTDKNLYAESNSESIQNEVAEKSEVRSHSEEWAQIENAENVIDLIILTPAGKKFDQEMAYQFSKKSHLLFACGRYEGIDSRVTQHYKDSKNFHVHEVSIGDYVLNGGEVAAITMVEAITRLIPGVVGNPESLDEESHSLKADGESLLEYPIFTKPRDWRGLEVPAVLLTGNHAEIQKWRMQEAKKRTDDLN